MSWNCISIWCYLFLLAGCKSTSITEKSKETCTCAVTAEFSKAFSKRPLDAVGGRQFMRQTEALNFAERQAAALQEILAGNIPGGLRIPALLRLVNEQGDTLLLPVAKDYLVIGSDSDFVRMPLSLPAAKTIAKRLNVLIPTPALVNAIYEQASIQLKPQPMHPGEEMRSNAYYVRHNELINEQADFLRFSEVLIAGHKKDVVLSTRMQLQPGRVPIYGWHLRQGEPIQPLSLVHGEAYEDYSHGLRLIGLVACLNGSPVSIEKLFDDKNWQTSLSGEMELYPKRLLELP